MNTFKQNINALIFLGPPWKDTEYYLFLKRYIILSFLEKVQNTIFPKNISLWTLKWSFCSVCIWLKVGEQVLHSIYDSFNLPTYCTLHFLSLVRLHCKVTTSCGQFTRLDISVASLQGYLSKWPVCKIKSLSGQFAGLDLYVASL